MIVIINNHLTDRPSQLINKQRHQRCQNIEKLGIVLHSTLRNRICLFDNMPLTDHSSYMRSLR